MLLACLAAALLGTALAQAQVPSWAQVSPGGTGPAITTQPANETAVAGESASFSATVPGTGNTYQRPFNGSVIAGATNAIHTIGAVTATNAGSYSVRITSATHSPFPSPYSYTAQVTGANATTGVAFVEIHELP